MQIQRYQKKPIEVEAVQLTKENAEEVAAWCGGIVTKETDAFDKEKSYAGVNYATPSGVSHCSEGAYMVKAPEGYFTHMPAAFFDTRYDPI